MSEFKRRDHINMTDAELVTAGAHAHNNLRLAVEQFTLLSDELTKRNIDVKQWEEGKSGMWTKKETE